MTSQSGIGLGIIGSGGIGRMHAEAAARAGSRIVACCDLDEARARDLAADFDGALSLSDLESFLALDDLDAVVVAVPNAHHVPAAIAAIRAGKDVLLEKPMALSVAECDELIAAAQPTDRIVQVGFVCRCSPATRLVEKLIASGRLGRIYHARAQWYRRRGIPGLGGWFTSKAASGGGVLIDLGVHVIDLVMHLTKRPAPRRVSGVCTSIFGSALEEYTCHEMWGGPVRPGGAFDVEDGASALIRFDGGMAMELSLTWAANIQEETLPAGLILFGDRGGVQFELWEDRIRVSTEEHGELLDLTPRVASPGTMWDDGWTEQHAIFARNVRARTQPTASMADGRQVQTILDAIYASSEQGREVEVAP